MNQSNIEKQHLSLIIPFAFRKTYSDCLAAMDSERFEAKEAEADRLFDYAEHLVSPDNSRHDAIGRHWAMRQAARKTFGLPNNHNHPICCRVKQQEWTFCIHEIEVYLFETQVGFVLYHIQFPDRLPITEQIEAVYYLKKLKNFGHELSFEQRLSKEERINREVHLSDLTCAIIRDMDPVTFFEGKSESPTEALVMSAVLLDSTAEEAGASAGSYLFHMRRSFKGSYKASEEEQDISGNENLLRLFANSNWGISLEGLANLVTQTGDPVTDHFFTGPYFHHIQHTYEYLYILTLHQKYAVLNLSNQASQLSYELTLHPDDPGARSSILNRMKERIIQFMLRSSYKQVSRSTHHAALYEWMRNRLQIDDLFEELRETMESLAALAEAAEQKQRLVEEEKKRDELERFNKKITGISAVFLPITIITGIYGIDAQWMDPLKDWRAFALLTCGMYLLTYVLFKFWFNQKG